MRSRALAFPALRVVSATIVGGIALALASVPMARAQSSDATPPEQEKLEEVVVTGSNLKSATVEEMERGAMPIDVITRKEIERNPGESLAKILRKQPYFSGANDNPSNIHSAWGDVARSTVNLRGMGSKYTQVVVDGRRFSSETNPADLGTLATEAIESTQILTGGASAIYGPNAVSGVVDIKLRKEFEGFQVSSEYGQSGRKDAANERYSMLFGTHTDRFRVVASAQFLDGHGFLRQNRKLTATENFSPWGGRDWRSEYSSRPATFVTSSNPDQLLVLNTDRVGPGQTATSPDDFRPFDLDRDAPGDVYGHIEEPMTRKSAHFVTEFDLLDERVQLYMQGFYDDMELGPTLTYYPKVYPGEEAPVPAGNPYNPFGEEVQVLFYRFSLDEARFFARGFNESMQGATGVRGKLGRFRYDVGFNYFHSSDGASYDDIPGGPLVASLARTDSSSVNLFGNNANSPAQMAGLAIGGDVRTRDRLIQVDAKVSGPLFKLPAGDLQASIGVEHRSGRLSRWNNEGDYSFFREVQFNGSIIKRKVDAYAGELLAPLYRSRDEDALLEFIEVGAGTRYEAFSDTGTQYFQCDGPCPSQLIGAQPKFNTQISQFTVLFGLLDDTLRVRAAYGGGFVSPTPFDLMAPPESYQSLEFDPVTGEETQLTIIEGGNIDLEPERASNLTYGFTYTPRALPGLDVNVDIWNVEVKDRITYPEFYQVITGTSEVGSVVRDPVTNLPTTVNLRVDNGGTQKLAGIDFGTAYSWKTRGGQEFSTNLAITYTTKGSIADRQVLGRYNFGETLPRLIGTAGIEWARHAWSVSFDMIYRGGVYLPVYDPEAEDYTDALGSKTDRYIVGNLYAGFDFAESKRWSGGFLGKASVWFGIEDLWDENVPFTGLWDDDPYDTNSGDIRGRYFYGGFRLGF